MLTLAATNMFDVDGLNLGLFLLRVVVGLTIIAHGYNHIYGGGKIEGTAGWFASMGLKPGMLHAWLASGTELVAGVLLVLGLLTPLAAAAVCAIMVVAWITAHKDNGFFIFKPGQGWEYVANLAVAAIAIGAMGPGEWSLDKAVGFHLDGYLGFLVAAVGGIGGALLLLAIYWRPEKAEATS